MTKDSLRFIDRATARIRRGGSSRDGIRFQGYADARCFDKYGNLKWEDLGSPNLVVNTGLDWILTNDLAGATLYMGLTDASPTPAAGDTMASHAGWTEFTEYTSTPRLTWGQGEPSSQQVTNATAVSFSVNANSQTAGGLFITTDSTKGGTAGTLFSVVAFSQGNKAVDSGDTIEVTYTLTAS